jgi:hypothetical protein
MPHSLGCSRQNASNETPSIERCQPPPPTAPDLSLRVALCSHSSDQCHCCESRSAAGDSDPQASQQPWIGSMRRNQALRAQPPCLSLPAGLLNNSTSHAIADHKQSVARTASLCASARRGSWAERLKRSVVTSVVSRAGFLGRELKDFFLLTIPPRTSGSGMDSFPERPMYSLITWRRSRNGRLAVVQNGSALYRSYLPDPGTPVAPDVRG